MKKKKMTHRADKNQGARKKNVNKNRRSRPLSMPKEASKRKVNTWREEDMLGAIQELKTGGQGLRQIARAWRVPKSTLERRAKRDLTHKYMLGKKTLFSSEQELQLEELLLDMARRGFPLTEQDVRKLAFQYAKCNRLPCRFPESKQMAGYYWMKGFLSRHPRLTVKSPEALSAARATGMNKPVISKWFDNYEKMLSDLNIKESPANIWNLDESGFQDYFLPQKAVGEKGVPLYQITGAERGETVTVLPVFNALGDFGPLMVIFKGGKVKTEWAVGSPPNTIVRASKDGYINSDLFVEFGRQFVQYLRRKASNACKHILVLDGHSTHTYNVQFLNLMRDNYVEVLCLPPHATHALQPADKTLFASMKYKWEEAGRRFVRESGGRRLDKKEFFAVFTPVWKEATTVEVCQNGFRSTGLFPCNRNAIPEYLYAPSLTTDRAQPGLVSVAEGMPSTDIPSTLSTANPQSPPDGVPADQPVPSVEVPSTSSTVNPQPPPDGVPADQPVLSVEVPSTSSTANPQPPPDGVPADQPVPSVEVLPTSSAVNSDRFHHASPDEGVLPVVSFYDIQTVPTRERGTKRKRRPLPSSILTSDDHFNFLSTKKKKPEPKKKQT